MATVALRDVSKVFGDGTVASLFRRGPRADPGDGDEGDGADFGIFPPQQRQPTGSSGMAAPSRAGTTMLEPSGRHHRARAEVAVRLAPYPSLRVGDPISVAIRIDQLHFFDGRGQRIDVGWR